MAGEDGQEYNDERQQQANPYVQESQEAVESSSKASYSLSSAQKGDVWGTEAGPDELGHSAGNMFNDVSEVLSKENDLIAEFEAKMKQAIESIRAAEADNEHAFQTVNHALEGVAGSEQAQALANTLEKTGFMEERPAQRHWVSGAPQVSPGQPSGSGAPATGGAPAAPTQGQQKPV
ncbi:hypothetical protein [Kytococcus sedentarius]|uniref:hypothetical protein n=1 Tax=Kytococcus sedentarius TaxID=1276 RepID=UPI00066152B4|nr:hypothetical protein [Kytococcus sedentarius]